MVATCVEDKCRYVLSYLRHLADVSNNSIILTSVCRVTLRRTCRTAGDKRFNSYSSHLLCLPSSGSLGLLHPPPSQQPWRTHTQKHRHKQKAVRPSLRCSAPCCQEHYWSLSKPNWKPFSHCFCPWFACILSGWLTGGKCDTLLMVSLHHCVRKR